MSNISDSVCFRKINPIKCVIMLLLAIAAVFNAVVADFVDSLIFIGLLGLVIVQVKFRNKSIATVVSVFSVLLFTSYFSQLLIVVGTDIAKIGKSALWFLFFLHDSTSILMNFALVLLFYIVLKTFGIKDKIVMMITPIPFLFLTLVDYFVVCYRGTELVAADFYSANTALDVISGHQLIFVYPIIYVFIPLIAFEYIVFVSETDTERKINLRYYVISTVRTVACVAVFAVFFRFYTNNHNVTTYGISPSMYNTFMNNFALSISILHPNPGLLKIFLFSLLFLASFL